MGFDPRHRQRIFPLASVSRQALIPTLAPIQWVPGILSRRKARPRRDTDHSTQFSSQARMSRSYNLLPLAPTWPYRDSLLHHQVCHPDDGSTSETLVYFYETTQRYSPESCNLHPLRSENLEGLEFVIGLIYRRSGTVLINLLSTHN
jgi:hypothetical protein